MLALVVHVHVIDCLSVSSSILISSTSAHTVPRKAWEQGYSDHACGNQSKMM